MLYFVLLFLLIILVFTYIYFLKQKLTYWEKRGVLCLKSSFIFGNYKPYILLQKYIGHVAQDICKKFPGEPYIGTYFGTEPALIVQDPELIKLVLTKEFYYFNGRENTKYYDREIVTNCMFFCGGDIWKIVRQNLSPIFTSAKMRNMFYLIQNCRETFEKILKEEVSTSPYVEAKSFATRYVMDTACSCVFGFNPNVLMNKNDKSNTFVNIGHEIYSKSTFRGLKLVFRSIWPYIFYGLRFKLFAQEIGLFFHKTITTVFQSRNYKQTSRNDFVDLILSWNSHQYLEGSSLTLRSEDAKRISLEITNDLLVAQCIQLFGGGFETSSSLISFILFELAKNKEAQAKLIEEVDTYLLKHDEVQYDCIYELPYLEACLDEAMRLYPLFGVLTRETMEDYTLSSGLCVEKGVRIHIPVYHLHHDPKYFPTPEKFQPERFLGEKKKDVTPYTFLPFGEGPRICIGMRFSKMQITPAFLTIFKDYEIELAEGMPTKLDFVPGGIVTQAAGGIHLKFNKRNKY